VQLAFSCRTGERVPTPLFRHRRFLLVHRDRYREHRERAEWVVSRPQPRASTSCLTLSSPTCAVACEEVPDAWTRWIYRNRFLGVVLGRCALSGATSNVNAWWRGIGRFTWWEGPLQLNWSESLHADMASCHVGAWSLIQSLRCWDQVTMIQPWGFLEPVTSVSGVTGLRPTLHWFQHTKFIAYGESKDSWWAYMKTQRSQMMPTKSTTHRSLGQKTKWEFKTSADKYTGAQTPLQQDLD